MWERTKEEKKIWKNNIQSNKQKQKFCIISFFQWLGLVFNTHERQKDRSLVIITIPIPQSAINIQTHPLQNNVHVSKVHCGSAFKPGASELPLLLLPPLFRSCLNFFSSCVVTKPKKQKNHYTNVGLFVCLFVGFWKRRKLFPENILPIKLFIHMCPCS